MSYDRQLDQVCPHIVVDEALFVSPDDRRSVRPLQPISSIDTVKVWLNGAQEIPSFGALLPASSSGSKIGPFNITTDVNDKFIFTVDQGAPQTITVPASKLLSAEKLADFLSRAAKGLQFSVSKGRITFRTASEGPGASLFVSSASTLANTLGIQSNREYRGRMTAPGWTLVSDPLTLSDRPARLVVFDEPLKSMNSWVELTYGTAKQDCRRCLGTGIENDWRYGRTGEVAQVRDEALLLQDVQKLFFTVLGSNPFHVWYGTSITEMIGKKLAAGGLIQNMIVSDVNQAFRRWQDIKRQQEQAVGQFLSDEEYPDRLVSATLEQSSFDPTVIFLNIVIQNRSRRPIELSRGLKLPEPLDLLTSQQGAFRQSLVANTLVG